MKKIFLFICTFSLLAITSCSKDDSPADTKFVKITINGIQKTFKTIVKTETSFVDPESGETYIDVDIEASSTDGSEDYIEFSFGKDITGPSTIYYLGYSNENGYYSTSNITSNITENNSTLIIGTFSGILTEVTNGTSITISNGSFDIR